MFAHSAEQQQQQQRRYLIRVLNEVGAKMTTANFVVSLIATILISNFNSVASESLYADHVTMQLEYSNPDDLDDILRDVQTFAKTCSQLNDFTVQGETTTKRLFHPLPAYTLPTYLPPTYLPNLSTYLPDPLKQLIIVNLKL